MDIVENIGTKKVFIMMDLRWSYNNVLIKKGDEWKAVFTTPKGSFKPTVIFSGLTNSPATFQTMMNEILCNLINIRKVASFKEKVYMLKDKELKTKIIQWHYNIPIVGYEGK